MTHFFNKVLSFWLFGSLNFFWLCNIQYFFLLQEFFLGCKVSFCALTAYYLVIYSMKSQRRFQEVILWVSPLSVILPYKFIWPYKIQSPQPLCYPYAIFSAQWFCSALLGFLLPGSVCRECLLGERWNDGHLHPIVFILWRITLLHYLFFSKWKQLFLIFCLGL